MRESLGTTWSMQLIIVFIFIFVAFLLLAVNYSKVFKMKNETVNIIEKYEGITNKSAGAAEQWGSVQIINNYLQTSGYDNTGKCPVDNNDIWYGMADLNSTILEKAKTNSKYYYCVRNMKVSDTKLSYFETVLFLKFDLPLIGNLMSFKIEGSTIDIKGAYCAGFENHDNKC